MADNTEIHNPSFFLENPEWEGRLLQYISQKDHKRLRIFLDEFYPSDIARLIGRLPFQQGMQLIQCLDTETQGEVLLELAESELQKYLQNISSEQLANIVQEQESDEAVDLLSELDKKRSLDVLARIPSKDRLQVTELLSYPEQTAGALMAKEFVAVRESETVLNAIRSIRKVSRETDAIHIVYVLDQEGRYRGEITLNRLILARPSTKVNRIMEAELLPIPVFMDQEEVAHFFTRYDFISAPVVDVQGVMLGRITVDDILEVQRDEASEDILRMGGVSGFESLATPLLRSSLKRVVWLCFNLGTAILAASVVRLFEATISQMVVLAALMPIVASMGGNAAGQTLAVIIRNLTLGELVAANAWRAIRRESVIGLLNGLLLGGLAAGVVYLFTGEEMLAVIIALAMLFNMLVAALAGTVVPLVLQRLRVDPAIASTIFVTTCTDVAGFFAFLGLAYLALEFGLI